MKNEFDTLTWNGELGWWSGRAEVGPGHEIDVHVEAANNPEALRSAGARAVPQWDRLLARELSVRAAVAGQLVEAHNGYCNLEDEVSLDQFADRLRLLSVRFKKSGSMELVYLGERLLGGHWIVVPIAADGNVGEAFEAG